MNFDYCDSEKSNQNIKTRYFQGIVHILRYIKILKILLNGMGRIALHAKIAIMRNFSQSKIPNLYHKNCNHYIDFNNTFLGE